MLNKVVILAESGTLLRFAEDLSNPEECQAFSMPSVPDSPGSLAVRNAEIAYAPLGTVLFATFQGGCAPDGEKVCQCTSKERSIEAVGVVSRDNLFYSADKKTGSLGNFVFLGTAFNGTQNPLMGFSEPTALALGPSHAFITGTFDGNPAIAKFEVGGNDASVVYNDSEPGTFLAVAVSPDETLFAWKSTENVHSVVAPGLGLSLGQPPYTGTPGLAATDTRIFIPSNDELRVCYHDGSCNQLRVREGRVADVLVAATSLYVLQGDELLQYDLSAL